MESKEDCWSMSVTFHREKLKLEAILLRYGRFEGDESITAGIQSVYLQLNFRSIKLVLISDLNTQAKKPAGLAPVAHT